MEARKIKELAGPGCRRKIRRGRYGAPWEPVLIAEFDEKGIVAEDGSTVPYKDIVDLMGDWEPPHEGARQCTMPHDGEARMWLTRGSWNIEETHVECGHWFENEEALHNHQRKMHSVWIEGNERMRGQARMNPAPVAEIEDQGESPDSNTEPTSRGPEGPTEGQLGYIESLCKQKGVERKVPLTKKEASKMIEDLLRLPDVESNIRHNKFDAPCSECGHEVPAGEGVLRKVDGSWLVGHLDGCPEEPDYPASVPDGRYAIDNSDGDTAFYQVKNGRKPGVVFIDLVIGGGYSGASSKRMPVANKQRKAILHKIIEAGVIEAAERFGKELGRCYACGRELTDETSRELGIGPDCRKKA
jgi:hypothetical protein